MLFNVQIIVCNGLTVIGPKHPYIFYNCGGNLALHGPAVLHLVPVFSFFTFFQTKYFWRQMNENPILHQIFISRSFKSFSY